jgi:hypothetical protein
MTEQEIPTGERQRFFDRFSKLHEGALITLRVGAHDEVVNRPFRRVSSDGADIIVDAGDAHCGHRIPNVAAVRLEQTDEGADAAIAMFSDSGTRAEVRFRSPIRADLLDPLVE